MAGGSPRPYSVWLLAERPELVHPVGELRWREWGHPPEPTELSWWVDATRREAGTNELPITWVAVDDGGRAIGAVGLGQFDPDELRDRSPWVLGMIVGADQRGLGIGRTLLARLEEWAAGHGITHAWVATEAAIGFYRSCGWQPTEVLHRAHAPATVLTKRLLPRRPPDATGQADRTPPGL